MDFQARDRVGSGYLPSMPSKPGSAVARPVRGTSSGWEARFVGHLKRSMAAACGWAALCGWTAVAHAAPVYRLESAVVLKGASPGWDYVTVDPGRSYLFLGRRAEGVTVFDAAAGRV